MHNSLCVTILFSNKYKKNNVGLKNFFKINITAFNLFVP
jgi:hypothetical protein